MQHDVPRNKWKQFINEVNYYWTELSSDEVDRVNGSRNATGNAGRVA